ncbi:DEAD/DEAH box helicase [Reichenbachiella agariperforans]|uniref:DEAD/DEAH box helicase n=1 Tax=Reichenbachiella agariperforans TaxID=156994 RepID=UPI001C086540|nr:DEAD/DEAH box helicase [Reichenbachiella agariperforans]MBU2915085.1 DEAD/DEAH box helicase [Reichenbachiella agariperforans]
MSNNIESFSELKLNKQIQNAIQEAGYTAPTPIQQQAIPLIQAGHDLMGIAQTGTGKTAAFVLPLLMKLKYAQGTNPRALILAPTRELAIQIEENVKRYATYLDIRHTAIYGGSGMKVQIEAFENGMDLVVATPGRFMDMYKKQIFGTREIKTLIIDEADKMMDMGFMPQIRQILEIIPVKRQNLLFSATMPENVMILSEEFLEFPEKIEVTPQASTVDTIDQVLYHVPNFKTKINMLDHLLENEAFSRVIIFVKTKANADNIFKFIDRKITKSVKVIHGNKAQNTRMNSIDSFKEGETRILVATDVAARGLDVSLVSHVINFDVPLIYEDYVHRIGRTGRATNKGIAITFSNQAEQYHIKKIEKLINRTIAVSDIPEEVEVEKTPFVENQEMLRELDFLKKKEDPDYKGAFHDKKKKNTRFDKKRPKRK